MAQNCHLLIPEADREAFPIELDAQMEALSSHCAHPWLAPSRAEKIWLDPANCRQRGVKC